MLTNINTGEKIQLAGQCLLEIKTRAEGQTEPLTSVTPLHVCQTELQMKCVGDEVKLNLLFFNLMSQSLRNLSTFLLLEMTALFPLSLIHVLLHLLIMTPD